ncbi:ATP-grasp domain-containing protein [Dehalobacter sp. DCA]|uniref:ATP-grasp domain-containing protein n=1 Tax=Dehalobacter sp. DCA TaxID=1147129 RepID=UPI00117E22F6|nr:ATP-grasp domain-containing protein [Dehalobacter sp. DCA]
MWTLMEARPDLKGKLPYGNLNTILYALDKWQTWKFTKKHKLPFAETIRADQANNPGKMKDFVKNVKFPLIAKPVRGFASKGVFYIRSWKDVETAADFDNYIFQEYLGDPANLKNYFNKMDSLTPLFAHTPNISHFSCHTIISPTGEISPVFISKNEHDSGVTTGFRKIQNSELENLTLNYARAIFAEGGAGPLTVQFRQNREGLWKAQEINLRTNGNTFPRLMFGQDDLGLIMKYFLPEYDFPVYSPKEDMTDDLVCKTLFCNRIDIDSIIGLKENQKWQQNK